MFVSSLQQGYAVVDSYKHSLCEGKILDFSQNDLIHDVGGFSGGIYECVHMKYANSTYGDVLLTPSSCSRLDIGG